MANASAMGVGPWAAAALVAAVAALAGCGEADPYDTKTDTGGINVLMAEMGDAATNPGLFQRNFDPASLPADADRAKYAKYFYRMTDTPRVEGGTATFAVEIKDQSGAVKATKDWTAVKIEGAWKLKSAPLP